MSATFSNDMDTLDWPKASPPPKSKEDYQDHLENGVSNDDSEACVIMVSPASSSSESPIVPLKRMVSPASSSVVAGREVLEDPRDVLNDTSLDMEISMEMPDEAKRFTGYDNGSDEPPVSFASKQWAEAKIMLRSNPSLVTRRILCLALRHNPPTDIIQFMLELNPKAAGIPQSGPTPLQVALQAHCSVPVVRLLLQACPLALVARNGRSPRGSPRLGAASRRVSEEEMDKDGDDELSNGGVPEHGYLDPLAYVKRFRSEESDLIELLRLPLSHWLVGKRSNSKKKSWEKKSHSPSSNEGAREEETRGESSSLGIRRISFDRRDNDGDGGRDDAARKMDGGDDAARNDLPPPPSSLPQHRRTSWKKPLTTTLEECENGEGEQGPDDSVQANRVTPPSNPNPYQARMDRLASRVNNPDPYQVRTSRLASVAASFSGLWQPKETQQGLLSDVERQELNNVKYLCLSLLKAHKKLAQNVDDLAEQQECTTHRLPPSPSSSTAAVHMGDDGKASEGRKEQGGSETSIAMLSPLSESDRSLLLQDVEERFGKAATKYLRTCLIALDMKERAMRGAISRMEKRVQTALKDAMGQGAPRDGATAWESTNNPPSCSNTVSTTLLNNMRSSYFHMMHRLLDLDQRLRQFTSHSSPSATTARIEHPQKQLQLPWVDFEHFPVTSATESYERSGKEKKESGSLLPAGSRHSYEHPKRSARGPNSGKTPSLSNYASTSSWFDEFTSRSSKPWWTNWPGLENPSQDSHDSRGTYSVRAQAHEETMPVVYCTPLPQDAARGLTPSVPAYQKAVRGLLTCGGLDQSDSRDNDMPHEDEEELQSLLSWCDGSDSTSAFRDYDDRTHFSFGSFASKAPDERWVTRSNSSTSRQNLMHCVTSSVFFQA